MPGNPGGTIPPTPTYERVAERLDTLEDTAAAMERAAIGQAYDHLQRAELDRAAVEASTLGRLGTRLDSMAAAGGKMVRKMVNNADQHLSNAYSQIYTYGGVYPSIERVHEGIKTGDALGTMIPYGNLAGAPAVAPNAFQEPPEAPRDRIVEPPPGGAPGGCPPVSDWGVSNWQQAPEQSIAGAFAVRPITDANGLKPGESYVQWTILAGQPANPVGDVKHVWTRPDARLAYTSDGLLFGFLAGNMPPGWCPVEAYNAGAFTTPEKPPPTDPPPGGAPGAPPPGSNGKCPPGLFWDDVLKKCVTYTTAVGGGSVVTGDTVPGATGGSCPVPPARSCGPEFAMSSPPAIGGDDICKAIADALVKLAADAPSIESVIGMVRAPVNSTGLASSIIEALGGDTEPIIPAMVNRFATWLGKVIRKSVGDIPTSTTQLIPIVLNQAALAFVEKWTGAVPDQVLRSLEHMSNTVAQSILPSGADADAAWLNDVIDRNTWECWHKANGNFLQPADQVLKGKRTRPDALQISQLHRRQQLTDDEYRKRIRGVGVTDEDDRKSIYELTQSWPGIEDVIRFLVRDVADKDAVEKFGMDDHFGDKWQGKLIDYAKAIGVPDELAKYYWRAHWHLPSYTQLSEMLHRLRPGRVDQKIEVDEKTVEKALEQDDMLPFWVKRMMAISYRVITRTDAVRSFMLRAMKDDELKEIIQDEGYTKEDAQKLFDFYEALRKRDEIRASGLPTPKVLLGKYAAGYIAQDTFEELVKAITLTKEQAQTMLDSAEKMVRIRHREAVVKGIKKQYCSGLIDDGEAQMELSNANVPNKHIGLLMDEWRFCVRSTGKHASAETLCKWFKQGILGAGDFQKALKRVGWENADAARIVQSCQRALMKAQAIEAERIAKANQAQLEKLQKIAEKQAKKRCTPKKPPPCEPDRAEDPTEADPTTPAKT